MNYKHILIQLVAFSILISGLSCKRGNSGNRPQPPVPVVPYTVEQKKVSYYDSYPGTISALNEVEIRSQVSGYVTGIYFKEGSKVTKGQKLYEIDRRKYQSALEQAQAGKEIAEANLEKAQRDADRYSSLIEQNAVARQVFEDAMTLLQDAKMQLKAAQSVLINAETDYNYSLITAPFEGTIGFSLVKPGAYIIPGQTLLNTISTDDPIGADFYVDEKSLSRFLDVSKAPVSDPDSTFRIKLPDNTDYPGYGRLSVIDRAVDRQTGNIKIRIVFPNQEGSLKPGMNCSVKVLNRNSGNRLIVPFRAVVEQMGEYFVYLIENNVARQVKVSPDLNLGEYIAVSGDLKPMDQIVLEGIQKIHNGSAVTTSGPETDKKAIADK